MKSKYRLITKCEFIIWYSIHIILENTFGNSNTNLVDHFNEIVKNKKIDYSFTRFRVINNSFSPSDTEIIDICKILSKNNYELLSKIDIVTIDESIISYKPSSKTKKRKKNGFDEIPVYYIPRKPHSNGLLLYLSATSIESKTHLKKNPFILNFFPKLNTKNSITTKIVLKKFMKYYPPSFNKCTLVCDAAFSSKKIFQKISDNNFFFVFSVPLNLDNYVWEVLSKFLDKNLSRVCKNIHNFLYSCNLIINDENKLIYQYILTNKFDCKIFQNYEFIENPEKNLIPIYSKKELKSLKRKEILIILKGHNLKI